jgi:DeoR family glycerol-3-phosphate regulon repressor
MVEMTETHSTHRELELLDTLRSLGGSARTANLAEALDVSEETVRRTVKALAKAELVQRVHGGVYLTNWDAYSPVTSRLGKHSEEKSRIAAAAARLIPNGSSIFLDVGSTTAYVAEKLKNHLNMTVVTNGLHPAQALLGVNHNRVFLAGGSLQQAEFGTFGPDAAEFVCRFNIETAVLSVDGIDTRSGFLLTNSAEADLARAVVARAKRCVVVVDHSKFGQTAPLVVCPPERIDMIVTDRPLKPVFQRRMAEWEIEVVIAEKGPRK